MCGRRRCLEDIIFDLHLSFEESLEKSIDKFLAAEEMSVGNFPMCEICNRITPHTAQTQLIKLPEILVCQLQR